MKYYFTLISNDYRADKNRLETAAKEATREASHRLVPETELNVFRKEFRQKIDELNKKHPRCRPLEYYKFDYHINRGKSAIVINGVCELLFYQAKNEL